MLGCVDSKQTSIKMNMAKSLISQFSITIRSPVTRQF